MTTAELRELLFTEHGRTICPECGEVGTVAEFMSGGQRRYFDVVPGLDIVDYYDMRRTVTETWFQCDDCVADVSEWFLALPRWGCRV